MKVCYPWNKTKNCPRLTGIPPHVSLLHQVEELTRKIDAFLPGVRAILDERNVGTPEYHFQEVMKGLQDVRDTLIREYKSQRHDPVEDSNIDNSDDGNNFTCFEENEDTEQEQASNINFGISVISSRIVGHQNTMYICDH